MPSRGAGQRRGGCSIGRNLLSGVRNYAGRTRPLFRPISCTLPFMTITTCLAILALVLFSSPAAASPPGDAPSPDFGPNVMIFDSSMADIQSRVDAVFDEQEKAQFGPGRFAFLFKPGQYSLDVRVGFYTQVAGLGLTPGDVHVSGAVRSIAKWMNGNATCNFWRSMENLAITPTRDNNINVWAVSQATWMRRVHLRGNIVLWDGGWSSGGFIADSKIDGFIDSGSQQQWFSRNAEFGTWRGGNWNKVFVGAVNAPEGRWPEKPYTVIEKTPQIREKPFVAWRDGQFVVVAPKYNAEGTSGVSWGEGAASPELIPIDRFHIARADRDSAESINAALADGKHLILTPGVYAIDQPVRVSRPGTIVLGLGYATLAPTGTGAALQVDDVSGVRIAGIICDAAEAGTTSLITVGEPGSNASHAADPIVLSDVISRNGGARGGRAECLMTIHSSNVIGDNLWIWRADHGEGAEWDINTARNGLIVNGDDVTMYGLFNEHTQEYQTIWNGERGRVYFYQSEMPYDPPSQEAWSHDGQGRPLASGPGRVRGYASYKVADHVREHEAWGLGVYCVFTDAPVIADTAIEAPEVPGVKIRNMITIRLAGVPGSGIARVINGRGEPVINTQKALLEK